MSLVCPVRRKVIDLFFGDYTSLVRATNVRICLAFVKREERLESERNTVLD